MRGTTNQRCVQWDIQANYDEWSIENIDDREKTLIEFVLEKWALPETRFDDIEEPEEAIRELTEKKKYVLHALCLNTGSAVRRDIHADVCEIAESPFNSPNSNGKERSEVGSVLSRLRSIGLADRNNYTWYPTEEATSSEISV